jgi:hypothetical protein
MRCRIMVIDGSTKSVGCQAMIIHQSIVTADRCIEVGGPRIESTGRTIAPERYAIETVDPSTESIGSRKEAGDRWTISVGRYSATVGSSVKRVGSQRESDGLKNESPDRWRLCIGRGHVRAGQVIERTRRSVEGPRPLFPLADKYTARIGFRANEISLAILFCRRRRENRGDDDWSWARLPVFGWITDPLAPLVSWDMHQTFSETVLAMPKLRRDTLSRVREDGFSFAAVGRERGLSVKGVERNLAEALADLRAALRDRRGRADGSAWAPDPDLILLGTWLAGEMSPEEESAMKERFLCDDAFYAKTAPAMQIWTLPMGMVAADEVEEQHVVGSDRDFALIADYLSNELSERDRLEVERLLETDVVFYVKVKPDIDIWRMPIDWRAELERYAAEAPAPEAEPDAWTGTTDVEEEEDDHLGDPDLMVISAWLHGTLPEHHERTVDDRLEEDGEFFEKVCPVMRVWESRMGLLERLGKGIGDEPADPADADVALITDYLGLRLPPLEFRSVEKRLKRDDAFARKVAPLVKKWRIPKRVVSSWRSRELARHTATAQTAGVSDIHPDGQGRAARHRRRAARRPAREGLPRLFPSGARVLARLAALRGVRSRGGAVWQPVRRCQEIAHSGAGRRRQAGCARGDRESAGCGGHRGAEARIPGARADRSVGTATRHRFHRHRADAARGGDRVVREVLRAFRRKSLRRDRRRGGRVAVSAERERAEEGAGRVGCAKGTVATSVDSRAGA